MEMDLEEAALGEVGEVTAPSGHTQAPEEGKGGASDKLRTTREEMEGGEDKIDEGRVAEAEGNNAEAEGGGARGVGAGTGSHRSPNSGYRPRRQNTN